MQSLSTPSARRSTSWPRWRSAASPNPSPSRQLVLPDALAGRDVAREVADGLRQDARLRDPDRRAGRAGKARDSGRRSCWCPRASSPCRSPSETRAIAALPRPARRRRPTAASASTARPARPRAPTSSWPRRAGSRTSRPRASCASTTSRMLVLDEADRMLDLGFRPAVDRIVAQCSPASARRCSSPPRSTARSASSRRSYTRDPVRVEPTAARPRSAPVEHRFLTVAARTTSSTSLVDVLASERELALVFVRTKRGAGRLAQRLERRGVRAAALHGDMTPVAAHALPRRASRAATPTRSWRPTSPPAASTSTGSRTSSTSIRRTTTRATCTASAAPAARAAPAPA